jgi:glycosyltransferase involved in cell wall biosynthesis
MKICIVSANLPPMYTGGGQQALTLGRELREQGHEPVFVTRWHAALAQIDTLDGSEIHRVHYPYKRGLHRGLARSLLNLGRLFVSLRNRYDVVLFFNFDGGFRHSWPVLLLLRAMGKKTAVRQTLVKASDPSALRRRKLGRLRLLPYRLHGGAISISEALAISYTSVFGDRGHLGLIPNGVDTHRFRPVSSQERIALRAQLAISPSLRYCVTVGRVSHRKGIDLLVEAWRHVVDSFDDARLLLVGPTGDEYRDVNEQEFLESLRRRIAEYGLDKTIIWVGCTEKVECYLQAADVFVFTSRREGCPNALLEAMACGLPIVTTRIPHVTDGLLTDEQEGLVTNSDPKACAEAIGRVLRCSSLAERLGAGARARVVEQFSIRATARRYVQVLKSIST